MKICKKMLHVQAIIGKLSHEIQFLNDAIHVKILNNPENFKILKFYWEIYTKKLVLYEL